MKKIDGKLYRRIRMSRTRLSDPLYGPEGIYTVSGDWPGDFPGRALLALCSLFEASEGHDEDRADIKAQIDLDIASFASHTNPDGYFGEQVTDTVDEQQVSGNSWFLRGLCKAYRLFRDPAILERIRRITSTFLYTIGPAYDNYPLNRRKTGEVSGSLDGHTIGGWKTSTDVGCAFIMLDGMTDVYELTGDGKLGEIIRSVIDRFVCADYVDLKFQTHATLSCTRGIIRFYQNTGEEKWLELAESVFENYRRLGMTYDYANTNWFGRPDTWTEPCGVVDSLLVAKKLYQITGKPEYLRFFNRCVSNALRTMQRHNGGAGCSCCATGDNYMLKNSLYEAFFCCTMRLGELFPEMHSFLFSPTPDGLLVPFMGDFTLREPGCEIHVSCDYTEQTPITVETGALDHEITLLLYVPDGVVPDGYTTSGHLLRLPLSARTAYSVRTAVAPRKEGAFLFVGDTLLTRKEVPEPSLLTVDGQAFSLIYDNSRFTESELNSRPEYLR